MTPQMAKRTPEPTPVRITELLKSKVNTPIAKGKERPLEPIENLIFHYDGNIALNYDSSARMVSLLSRVFYLKIALVAKDIFFQKF